MMEAERGNSSEAGEKESPSVESLQESAKESSPSSSSGSPDLMDLTTASEDSEEKSDSVQEVDTEVNSFCLHSLCQYIYPAV